MEDTILKAGPLIVTPVVTEYHLAQSYMKMIEEGTLATVFYQGIPTLRDFLNEYMTAGRRITLGCFKEREQQQPELCGLGWVYGAVSMGEHFRAETGMVFFRRQSKRAPTENLEFGHLMLQMFFTRYNIDALFGTTPEPNKLAIRYACRLGFDMIGPVEDYCVWNGELCAGWISHYSKKQWIERNQTFSAKP